MIREVFSVNRCMNKFVLFGHIYEPQNESNRRYIKKC
jgi:hypothetical protein